MAQEAHSEKWSLPYFDEVHVWIHPVLAGTAEPADLWFRPGSRNALLGTTSPPGGVTIVRLAPVVGDR